jgi:hypothetical protein
MVMVITFLTVCNRSRCDNIAHAYVEVHPHGGWAVSFATDGDETEVLETGYHRRPISVAQLLEREGYRPAVRSRTARRALSGVAAGAVLALGAVVGSLFLNHGERTTGDVASAGLGQSGGDIVLAESNTPTGAAPAATTHAAATTTAPQATTHHRTTTPSATGTQTTRHHTSASTSTASRQTAQAQAPAQSASTGTTNATTQPAPTTTATAPTKSTTTTTTPSSTTQSTQQSTTQSTQQTTTPPASSQPGDSGVLGNVGQGVGQILNGVTQPVFNWFGG